MEELDLDAVETWARVSGQGPLEPVLALVARCRELGDELERERVRLAGCGVAALGYMKADDCQPGTYGHSASFDDVKRLYAEKERLRLLLEKAEAVCEECEVMDESPHHMVTDSMHRTLAAWRKAKEGGK